MRVLLLLSILFSFSTAFAEIDSIDGCPSLEDLLEQMECEEHFNNNPPPAMIPFIPNVNPIFPPQPPVEPILDPPEQCEEDGGVWNWMQQTCMHSLDEIECFDQGMFWNEETLMCDYPGAYEQEECELHGGIWHPGINVCEYPEDEPEEPTYSEEDECDMSGGTWNSSTNTCDM